MPLSSYTADNNAAGWSANVLCLQTLSPKDVTRMLSASSWKPVTVEIRLASTRSTAHAWSLTADSVVNS